MYLNLLILISLPVFQDNVWKEIYGEKQFIKFYAILWKDFKSTACFYTHIFYFISIAHEL